MKRVLFVILATVFSLFIYACGDKDSTDNRVVAENVRIEDEESTESIQSTEDMQDDNGIEYIEYEIGDIISNEYMEYTLNKIWASFDLLPSDTSEGFSYGKGEEGKKFFYLDGKLKNVYTEEETFGDNCIINIVFDNKYTYKGKFCVESSDRKAIELNGGNIIPFEERRVLLYTLVPSEVLDIYQTVSIQWSFDDFSPYLCMKEENELKNHYQINAKQNRSEIEAYELYKGLGGNKNPYEYYTDGPEENSSLSGTSYPKDIYNKALEEGNKGHFVYANLLFSEILDFEDVQECYDITSELLGTYNGHYEINLFAGGSYTMDLENGMGILTFNHGAKYIVEMIGFYDGVSELPKMSLRFTPMREGITDLSEWFNKNNSAWHYSDSMDMYQIMLSNDGTKLTAMIIACDGNNYTSFNGSGSFKQSK